MGRRLTFPQLGHAYRACWVISIFLTLGGHEHGLGEGMGVGDSRLSERSTVSGTVLSGDTELLCSFSLRVRDCLGSVWARGGLGDQG